MGKDNSQHSGLKLSFPPLLSLACAFNQKEPWQQKEAIPNKDTTDESGPHQWPCLPAEHFLVSWLQRVKERVCGNCNKPLLVKLTVRLYDHTLCRIFSGRNVCLRTTLNRIMERKLYSKP